MKVLLRQKTSGLYYGPGGEWVSELFRAVDFKAMDNAINAAEKEILREALVIFRSEEPQYEICVAADRLPSRKIPAPKMHRKLLGLQYLRSIFVQDLTHSSLF